MTVVRLKARGGYLPRGGNIILPRDEIDIGPSLPSVIPAAVAAFVTKEESDGPYKHTKLTLTDLVVNTVDATTAGAHGSATLLNIPAGLISLHGAFMHIALEAGAGGIADTAAVVGAIGSVPTVNDNATLTGTEADIIPSTVLTLTGGVRALTPGYATAKPLLGTLAAPLAPKLNFAIPDAGSAANDTLTVNGTIEFLWSWLGDI